MSTPTDRLPPLAVANAALRQAERTRAEWLLAIREGLATPFDLIHEAATDQGGPLMVLSLRQVLQAQRGWGDRRVKNKLIQVVTFSESTHPNPITDKWLSKLKVSWLLDPKCAGSRYIALCNAMIAGRYPHPWNGYPFTTPPNVAELPDVAALNEHRETP